MVPIPAILLIDDDPTANYLNQRLLVRMEVSPEILLATNGQQAMTLLKARCQSASGTACPTLILLDVNMPVMNGIEFLQVFAQLPYGMQQPFVIVLLTTSQLDQDMVRAQHLPVTAFLTKPLRRADVVELLRDYFNYSPPDGPGQ